MKYLGVLSPLIMPTFFIFGVFVRGVRGVGVGQWLGVLE